MIENNSFLPEDYQQPKGSNNYMKLEQGENKIRILSKPILGWLDWKDKKPLRFRMNAKPEKPVDATKPIKHFWAMLVWDYRANDVMVLEITQATIQKNIVALSKDAEWGAPYGYDIKINKKGTTKDDTEYSVIASPPKKLSNEIVLAFNAKPCYLEALFEGDDPWAAIEEVTPMEDLPF